MAIRSAFKVYLRPGALEEWVAAHENVWPELLRTQGECGFSWMTIYAESSTSLVVVSEVADEGAWDRLIATDVHKRWVDSLAHLSESSFARLDGGAGIAARGIGIDLGICRNRRGSGRGAATLSHSSSHGEFTAAEVASQPDVWRRALALSTEELRVLPGTSESVLALGCGTSFYMLDAYARRRQELVGAVTRAAIASELDEIDGFDRVLLLSRSGTTTELVHYLDRLAGATPTVCICGSPASPVALRTDASLVIPFADERSVVQTRFATTALVLLRQSIGDELGQLASNGDDALDEPLPAVPGEGIEHVVFLGTRWTLGLANEAALKCREGALLFAEAYAVGEYRHGPIALATEATLVWSFSPLPPDVREAIAATGARLVEVTRDPLAELPRVHRFALEFAFARGLDPDTPRNLSRSVVLSGSSPPSLP